MLLKKICVKKKKTNIPRDSNTLYTGIITKKSFLMRGILKKCTFNRLGRKSCSFRGSEMYEADATECGD